MTAGRVRRVWMGCAILASLGCGDAPAPPGSAAPSSPTTADVASATWSEAEIALVASLGIGALRAPPPSASNRVADDARAAELGHRLFFDAGLSRDASVSCATCHVPERFFTDGRATSRGLADGTRNAPTLVGSAHAPWQFWDGRRDSLWAQALAPLEAAGEMGSTRIALVRHVAGVPELAGRYVRVFGAFPALEDASRFPERAGPFGDAAERDAWQRMAEVDRQAVDAAFANLGKAIEAYERLLQPAPSRFDRFAAALRERGAAGDDASLDDEEIAGLRLFLDAGRSLCLRCHNGPLLTNQVFHDIGTALGEGPLPDFGRFLGLQAVRMDPFNCLGPHSDADPRDCGELRFMDTRHAEAELGKFKTPTLRGLPRTAPYMHDGRFGTLAEVVEHYRRPPVGPDPLEITPLELSDEEARALVAFLESLDGGVAADAVWLAPPRRD